MFVVATPFRSVCDDNARVLAKINQLRSYITGTRNGAQNIANNLTVRNPLLGGSFYLANKTLPPNLAEGFRFATYPLFDHWLKSKLHVGDNIISSYSYANKSFKLIKKMGGLTFLDAGNSHPDNYLEIMKEEYKRWNIRFPRRYVYHLNRAKEMLEYVDFILSPSNYVTSSFLKRGFNASQVISNIYPVNFINFRRSGHNKIKSNNQLTIICTATISLRKGIFYLLEAFSDIQKKYPKSKLILINTFDENLKQLLNKYNKLNIEWIAPVRNEKISELLNTADIFVLPTLEDGFARTVTEALVSGLPVITTNNCGAKDFIIEGENGSIVAIRNSKAIEDAISFWWEKIKTNDEVIITNAALESLSYEYFEKKFLSQLEEKKIIEVSYR